ncbi:cytochrome b/b6 domain-containing protein [Microbacterium sp. NPDC090007]|uniref:cytochrome b/b6 domain-containing protein n=1 Tax=Microbacterium sp. NPDC090007 TaxID=3364204 RepID=UPI00381E0B20
MASTPRSPRRGLPRVPGGQPWPPAASGAPSGEEGTARRSEELAAPSGEEHEATMVPADHAHLVDPTPPGTGSAVDPDAAAPVDTAHAGDAPAPADIADTGDAAPVGTAHAGATSEPGPAAGIAVRRGLPREPGGAPWPPASVRPDADAGQGAPGVAGPPDAASVGSDAAARPSIPGAADADRRDGFEPHAAPESDAAGSPESLAVDPGGRATSSPLAAQAGHGPRRGLPREPGGAPWPPASAAPPSRSETTGALPAAALDHDLGASAPAASPQRGASDPAPRSASAVTDATTGAAPSVPIEARGPRPPLTVRRTVWPGAAARAARNPPSRSASDPRPPGSGSGPAARPPGSGSGSAARPSGALPRPGSAPAPRRAAALGDFTPAQLLGSTAVLGVFALALAGIAVLLARFVLALDLGREFLAAFPGEYHLPEGAPVGLPAWLNWSHFLNSFFLLFIIRTGWQVRREKRPAAFWSPRTNKKRRISLALWFHQSLDILWIANGVVFVVLLFVTGQWMRIVPTSWEVFPNALSAALQYVSLDWPTENGWVNYNSLQQLSYFAITFVAAPLAIVSGVRLSGVWPKDAEKLNRLYPVEWARAVHFPVMLFFVAFIVVHVFLVLATGALRNLNHMYAARGSVDPAAFTSDPTGLLLFAASLLVMAVAWVAARPAVLVPIARLFGDVKQR